MNDISGSNRAIIYCRVSTDEQAEHGYSLPDQEARCREFCAARALDVVDCISDDFTGKLLSRPGLQQITDHADRRAFDVLVCIKIDRLARVNYLRRQFEEWLSARGVRVEYVQQTFF